MSNTPKKLPRISLVIPSYNQGRFIADALDSIFDQNYPDIEVIVIDGGSSDNTVEVLKRYDEKLSYWQSCSDGGQSDAINTGLARASGEIFNWLCCDDLLTPGSLQRVGSYFAEHDDCKWLGGAGKITYLAESRTTTVQSSMAHRCSLLEYWLWGAPGHYICQPSCFWRRDLWEISGGLNVDNHLAMDFELWLSFARHSELNVVTDVLSESRIHPDCKSAAHRRQQILQTMQNAYHYARLDGISPIRLSGRTLCGLMAMRATLCRKYLRQRWFGGAAKQVLEMTCDVFRVWNQRGRLNSLKYM